MDNYISQLRKLSNDAAQKVELYVNKYGLDDKKSLIDYVHAVVTKYGEGSATLSAQMYEAIAELQGADVLSAIVAPTATYGETAKAVYGSLKQSPDGKKIGQIADRLVKQSSADTMLQNAKRDNAEWAWVPSGITCAFCIMLASEGWRPASVAQMRGYHADHIHANCDCQFMIRFNKDLGVADYDPNKYKKMYQDADTTDYDNKKMAHPKYHNKSTAKLNALRRELEWEDDEE